VSEAPRVMVRRPTDRSRRTLLLGAIVLVVGTILVWAPVRNFGFVRYDDPNYVQIHPRVSQGLSGDNLVWALTAFEVGNWHPLTLVSHMADVSAFGPAPGAHHVVNLLFHAANVVLLFLLLAKATGRRRASLLAASLFAVHPLNVESIAWIAQRKSVLCMFFLLSALLAHVVWSRRGGVASYGAGLLALGAALAAKPMAVVGPLLMLLLDGWPLGRLKVSEPGRLRRAARLVLEKAPHLVLAAAASVVTLAAQSEAGAVGTLERFPVEVRLAHAVFAGAWYLVRMVWPADLALFYPTSLGPRGAAFVTGAAVLLAAVTATVFRFRRRRPDLAFAWLWYLVALAPVVGVIQFGTQIVADRYAYLALIGPFAAVAIGVDELLERLGGVRRACAIAVTATVLLALILTTRGTLAPWRDSNALLERGVRRAPDNMHAVTNLGLLLVEQGRLDEGIALLERAEKEVPLFPPVQANLGYAYAKQGRLEEARSHYEQALRLRPDDPKLTLELGRVLAQLDRTEEAETILKDAIRLDPDSKQAHLLLGTLLYIKGRWTEAIGPIERAVALAPGDARSRTALGLVLEGLGRREDALAALRTAVRLDPDFGRARVELERVSAGGPPPGDPALPRELD